MNLADRIQNLRKLKGITQETLADTLGVSRQAVSKWESGQSEPESDKIIGMSEYFGVTTDYILKGTEPVKTDDYTALGSSILYIASTALIAIGLLSAFAGWYEEQTAEVIWGSMIIQVVGAAAYFIGRLLSRTSPSCVIDRLNIIIASFMPLSLIATLIFTGTAAPYPTDIASGVAFAAAYVAVIAVSFLVFKKDRGQP
ncbi:MAG: helix-turn-helix transcriptional regulator [Eubacteriales bacterium]|nr:helix-turn-helix transcriptional regulator [Eubacteriales bacterium]